MRMYIRLNVLAHLTSPNQSEHSLSMSEHVRKIGSTQGNCSCVVGCFVLVLAKESLLKKDDSDYTLKEFKHVFFFPLPSSLGDSEVEYCTLRHRL
ncbi:hypothetical protein Y032_0558g3410 [Ancylostoma ceylanicum]|nr:hypothetical protein Y032_0558g3410 [Ancylostoma ceylanicum]